VSWTKGLGISAALLIASASIAIGQLPQSAETFDAAWTIIRDTHFDKSMNGLDWNAVRAELRPRAAAASSPAELRAVIREMLARLGLSHFALIPAAGESALPEGASADTSGDPGIEVRLLGRDLIVTHVDDEAASPVRPGWRIVEIGSRPAAELLRTVLDAEPGQSPQHQQVEAWRIAQMHLRGPAGSKVDVAFENGQGATVRVSLSRRPEAGVPVTVGNLPTMYVRLEGEKRSTPSGETAGVIKFNVWMAAVDAQFQRAMDELRNADGIVIDLRGNPGGLAAMLMGISGHFIGERRSLGVMKTRERDFKFVANPRLVNLAGERVEPYAGPVAILMDSMSGSASECFAGGMQSIGRARVFGQTSMGQALPALFDRLPNGDVLIHAYGDFVTADGTRLEGRGVIPDESVPLTRADLLRGDDKTLQAALAWIDRAKASQNPQHAGNPEVAARIVALRRLSLLD
jgi:carboxyl-terminal processing protease